LTLIFVKLTINNFKL